MLKEFVLKDLSFLLKQFSLLLKESVVLKSCDIFSIFVAVNVESEVLINLESVESDYLKLGKSGVDKALRLVGGNTLSNYLTRHLLHNL